MLLYVKYFKGVILSKNTELKLKTKDIPYPLNDQKQEKNNAVAVMMQKIRNL